jgi:hypothetical protein
MKKTAPLMSLINNPVDFSRNNYSAVKCYNRIGEWLVFRIKLCREFVNYALGIISPAKFYRTCFSQ